MTYEQARLWLVWSSLVLIVGYGLILIAAPTLGFPLTFDESIQLLQIIFPLFLGYVSSAVVFVFQGRPPLKQDLSVSDLLPVAGPELRRSSGPWCPA